MILVVGATGVLGIEICRRLAPAGNPFRAMVRSSSDPAKKNVLKNLGGELVEADLKDRASLDRASAEATAVISTPTAIGSQQEDDSIETVDLHEEALQARKAGATNPVELTFADLTLTVAQGDAIDISKTFKKFSVRSRSVRE